MDEEALKAWIGRTEETRDIVAKGTLDGLAALLDYDNPPWPEGCAPPLAHWLYFLPRARQSQIGTDGHPKRGGGSLVPPIELPRRMWAGSRVTFSGVLAIGAEISRRSEIADIKRKTGKSGEMAFVTMRHEIAADGALRIVEEQDIVYREPQQATTAAPRQTVTDEPPGEVAVSRSLTVDTVQLFRFSALTFNSHRIHYDRDYATREEGYPGLVVHGPYLATLLMDHFLRNRPGGAVTSFQFRARAPLFDGSPFSLNLADINGGAALWVADAHGRIAMTATVTRRSS
ncbi:MAG: MaoC family dehydratase N-terminal domain-containing protein [Amphiplicatus sp.]